MTVTPDADGTPVRRERRDLPTREWRAGAGGGWGPSPAAVGAGVVEAVVIAYHHDDGGVGEGLGQHPQEGDEVGCAAAAEPARLPPSAKIISQPARLNGSRCANSSGNCGASSSMGTMMDSFMSAPLPCMVARQPFQQALRRVRAPGGAARRRAQRGPHRRCVVVRELRREAGESVEAVSAFLDHSSLAVTTTYLRRLAGVEERAWREVAAALGA